MSALPAWATQMHAALDAADARARAVAKPLSTAQLNWRADASSWGVGHCLDHLRITNEVYARAMDDALTGRPTGPVEAILPGWFGRYFIRTVIDPSSATGKYKAPVKIVPVTAVDGTMLDQFLHSNQIARRVIDKAVPYDVNRVRFANPLVSVIRFTVGTGLEILTRHQDRHLRQAERVRANPTFPSS